jgi:hypothetical protein
MNGYDLGGAEYPYNPGTMTVVDIATPDTDDLEVGTTVDYLIRDLSKSGWNAGLEPRENVYLGKVLRYLEQIPIEPSRFAGQVDQIVDVGGRIEMFDWMQVIEPIMTELLRGGMYEVFSIEMVNPPFDGEPAEYRIVLMGR